MVPGLVDWRHAVTTGQLEIAFAGVAHHPAMAPRPDWPGHPAIVDALPLRAPRLVRALIRAAAARGENLNAPDQQGETVLDRVLAHQHQAGVEPGSDADVVPLLLISGARPETSRFWATVVGAQDPAYLRACLKAYPSCHAWLNAQTRLASPLHQVVGSLDPKAVSLVRRLLRAGADPQLRDEAGCTPWMHAADPAVLAAAIEAGVRLDAQDQAGKNVLHHLLETPDGRLDAAQHAQRVGMVLAAEPALVHQGPSLVASLLAHWPLTQALRQAQAGVAEQLFATDLAWTPAQQASFLALPDLPVTTAERAQGHWRAWARQRQLQTQPAVPGRSRPRA